MPRRRPNRNDEPPTVTDEEVFDQINAVPATIVDSRRGFVLLDFDGNRIVEHNDLHTLLAEGIAYGKSELAQTTRQKVVKIIQQRKIADERDR